MLFIGYQAYENGETSENGVMSNLKPNGESYSSGNILDACLMSCMTNLSYKNKNEQIQSGSRNKKNRKSKKCTTIESEFKNKDTSEDPKEVTTRKRKKWRSKFFKMKYQLYHNINELRKNFSLEPLEVNKTLSIQLQRYVKKFINRDKDLKPLNQPLEELYDFCYPGNDYDPIKKWSQSGYLLTDNYNQSSNIDSSYTKLLSKESTHIGCGVYGDESGTATFCKITPKANVIGEQENSILD